MAASKIKTKTVKGEADGTGFLSPTHNNPSGQLNVSIDCSSDWNGTIVLQRQRDGGTVKTVKTYTEDAEEVIEDFIPGVVYRLWCISFTAGEAVLEIYR
jgi:hypothetical protein